MAENPIRCVACSKQIAKGFMVIGSMEIPCKCGVLNKIEAKIKPESRVTSAECMPSQASTARVA